MAVLLTCHNRRESTRRCLELLYAQKGIVDIELNVIIVDDGSTDGTSQMIRTVFPEATLIQGDGNLYWNHGMRKAFEYALPKNYDFFLWVNDDTYLAADALSRLLQAYEDAKRLAFTPTIIIGSVKDPRTGRFSYGGIEKGNQWNPLKLKRQPPEKDALRRCFTMNGNFVLIDKEAAHRTGNLDKHFQHRWGDFDYGMRAFRKGVNLWIAPGYFGDCKINDVREVWKDPLVPFSRRFRVFNSIKGFKFNEWLLYSYRHGGSLWFLNFLNPYIDLFFPRLKSTLRAYRKVNLKPLKI